MMKERVGFFASFNERLRKLFHTDPDRAARFAMQEKMERSFTHTNPPPPSVPMVSKEGEFVWKESQCKSETR